MWCSDTRLIDERVLYTASVTSKPLRGAVWRRGAQRYIDIASILRRADRVLTITHLGWYHVVLTYPPDRRTGIVYRVSNV